MIENDRPGRQGQPPPSPFTIAWFAMWISVLLESIARIFEGSPTAGSTLGQGQRASRPVNGARVKSHYGERRSIVSYINSGLAKVERARRSSAVGKQYGNSMRTIKLTQRAVRSSPKQTRQLFSAYLDVLRESRDRLRSLHTELDETERHLKAYDVHAIEDEIERMERHTSVAGDLSSTIEARRELLSAVQRFDQRWADLANQIAAISAALELNHLRILSIINGAGSGGSIRQHRLDEATEQIAVLEETLRELA